MRALGEASVPTHHPTVGVLPRSGDKDHSRDGTDRAWGLEEGIGQMCRRGVICDPEELGGMSSHLPTPRSGACVCSGLCDCCQIGIYEVFLASWLSIATLSLSLARASVSRVGRCLIYLTSLNSVEGYTVAPHNKPPAMNRHKEYKSILKCGT